MKRKNKIILIISIIFILIFGMGLYIKIDKTVSLKSIHNKIVYASQVQKDKVDKKYNSLNKLNIVSPYGDDEAYHPKVLNFKEKWNGYKYWMSYTPYPQGDDSKENPCIVASNDLINWEHLGDKKTVLDEPKETIKYKKYNSDSHIVYNNDLDRLECYWRYVDDIEGVSIIYRKCTKNGIDWTENEVSYLAKPRKIRDYVSPSIIYDKGTYKMWSETVGNKLIYTTSIDGLNWEKEQILKLDYEDNVKLWHLDVIKNKEKYEMISVAYENWDMRNDMSLYYSKSEDGINWTTSQKILEPTKNTKFWDNKGIYRSSFIYEDGKYYVYYSGTDVDYHHGIGFVYGKDIFNLNKVDVNYKNKRDVNKLVSKIKSEEI